MGWASYPREPVGRAPALGRALAGGVGLGLGVALILGLGVAQLYEAAVVLAVALAHGSLRALWAD